MKNRIILLFVFFLCFGREATTQTWREVPLPRDVFFMNGTGNPTRAGSLAIWIQSKPLSDSAHQIWFTPAHFYTSSNGGSTWDFVDSTVFTFIDTPPLFYSSSPSAVSYVGNTIVRTTIITEGTDAFHYEFEHRSGASPFVKRTFPHPTNINEGTPCLFLTDAGDLYNIYMKLSDFDDSTLFALMRSTNGGAAWQYIPDSANGFHRFARATSLGYRYRFPAVMYLGTVYGIYRSADAGSTFINLPTNTPLDELNIRFTHVHPKEPNIVFASGYNAWMPDRRDKLFQTSDDGRSWQQVFADTIIRHLSTSDIDPRLVMISTSSGMYLSTDRGVNWKSIHVNLPPVDGPFQVQWIYLDPGKSSRAFVGYFNKIFVTDNLITGIVSDAEVREFELYSSYPNPYSISGDYFLTVRFALPKAAASLTVRLIDLLGRTVHTRVEKNLESGVHERYIGRNIFSQLSSGVYFLSAQVGADVKVQKVVMRN